VLELARPLGRLQAPPRVLALVLVQALEQARAELVLARVAQAQALGVHQPLAAALAI
jgi:hypothetical protein